MAVRSASSEGISRPEGKNGVKVMDRLFFWWGAAVLLVLIVYMPTLVKLFIHMVPVPGMRLW